MITGALRLFAIAAPGIEHIAAQELLELGIRCDVAEGGVGFLGTLDTLYRANLMLRTASRVVMRLSEFHASAFHELERQAQRVPWEVVLEPGRAVRVRVTSRKSRLYHSDAVAERILRAISHRMGLPIEPWHKAAAHDDGASDGPVSADERGAQLFIVRLNHDRCTVSADSSGMLLHRRGYRQQTAKAPLRETLAAAMLLGSRWTPDRALVDPFCGSGTIAIEAALIARRIAPGLGRSFDFERWPDFDPAHWATLTDLARAQALTAALAPIRASDRDAGAIVAARANVARAGVGAAAALESDIELRVATISEMPRLEPPGYVVTNPPFGVRVGERASLRSLYARFGEVLRERAAGSTVALLSADRRLEGQMGLSLEHRFRTRTGGIPVRLMVGTI